MTSSGDTAPYWRACSSLLRPCGCPGAFSRSLNGTRGGGAWLLAALWASARFGRLAPEDASTSGPRRCVTGLPRDVHRRPRAIIVTVPLRRWGSPRCCLSS